MTQEQIKQNAEYFATHLNGEIIPFSSREYEAYIAGAHSRDEEVERLENENVELSEQLKMNAENIQKLRAELKKAQNPWVSVEERLPEKIRKYPDCQQYSETVYIRCEKGLPTVGFFNFDTRKWHSVYPIHAMLFDFSLKKVTAWMPIPKGGDA